MSSFWGLLKRLLPQWTKFRKACRPPRIPDLGEFHRDVTFRAAPWAIVHPSRQSWWQEEVLQLCRQRLSTGTLPLLEQLYGETSDPFLRGVLARKIHWLRLEYLRSFKEHSDRALILLTHHEKLVDKWEGIYILGEYGRGTALKYLQALATEKNEQLLQQAIQRSIQKIKNNIKRKQSEKGFG